MGVQVPAWPASAQDMHFAVQAVPQQTPWAHELLAHSDPPAHAAPAGLRPQEPERQKRPEAQSLSVAQVVLQAALTPQAYGMQDCGVGVTQVPAPSQLEPGV
jgi:hypothetical protein